MSLVRRYPNQAAITAGTAVDWAWRNRDSIRTGARNVFSSAHRGFERARASAQSRRANVRAVNRASFRTASGGGPSSYRVSGHRFRSRFRKSKFKSKRRPTRRSTGSRKNGFNSTMWKALCTPQIYKETYAFSRNGTQGQRTWASQEIAGYAFINTTVAAKRPSNFLFNTASGASSTAVLQDLGQNNWQVQINKCSINTRLQNRSNASMELKIYECLVRRDVQSSAFDKGIDSWQRAFQANMDPNTLVGSAQNNVGPGQAANPSGLAHMWQHPTFTPYMSNEFVNFFKILRTYSYNLGPNEIIQKRFSLSKRKFKGAMIETPSSCEWQKGWSKMILYSWVGMPVDDGTSANQSKAKTDLFIQTDFYAQWHYLPGQSPLYNIGFGNPTENSITSTYRLDPAGMTSVIPACATIQVPASAADTCPLAAP